MTTTVQAAEQTCSELLDLVRLLPPEKQEKVIRLSCAFLIPGFDDAFDDLVGRCSEPWTAEVLEAVNALTDEWLGKEVPV